MNRIDAFSGKDTQAGFTLVEMMVVVALIGILAAIAVPSYQKYTARSRQTEARIALANLFTAEKNYYVASGTYTLCLANIGYGREGVKKYYTVGFNTTGNTCGGASVGSCLVYDWQGPVAGTGGPCTAGEGVTYFSADSAAVGGATTVAHLSGTSIQQERFIAAAAGRVLNQASAPVDGWLIDDRKIIQNSAPGL